MSSEDIRNSRPLPGAGPLLKKLVAALSLDSNGVTSVKRIKQRSPRRIFIGDRVAEGSLQTLIGEIVHQLIDSDLFPLRDFRGLLEQQKADKLGEREFQLNQLRDSGVIDTRIFQELDLIKKARSETIDLRVILSKRLFWFVEQYDRLASNTSRIPSPHPNLLWAVLRLATVELGMRYAGLLVLEGRALPQGLPLWAKEGGASLKLRELFDQCKPNLPRRPNNTSKGQDWSTLLGVSPSVLDRYLAHNDVPSPNVLKTLAKELATRIEGQNEKTLFVELRRHYAAYQLATEVAGCIGRERFEDIVDYLCGIATVAARILTQNVESHRLKQESARQGALYALVEGCMVEPTRFLLRSVVDQLPDPLWKGDALAICNGRIFERVVHYVMVSKQSDLNLPLSPNNRELADLPPEIIKEATLRAVLGADVASTTHYTEAEKAQPLFGLGLLEAQLTAAMQNHDIAGAEKLLRKLITEAPQTAAYHYSLGQLLMDKGEFDECKKELWLAFEFCQSEESYYVDIAACLIQEEKFEEAIKHLENKPTSLQKQHSGLYAHWLGRSYFFAGRHSKALQSLETAIALKQDVDYSYDLAAEAAFRIGDKSKGKRYAKNAKSLGCSRSFDLWKSGQLG